MGGVSSTAAPVSAEDHENQVRNLRDRNAKRMRELNDTWQARYAKLDNEGDLVKKIAGGCCVVAGFTIAYLSRRGGGGSGGSGINSLKSGLQQEAALIKRRAKLDVAAATTKSIKALSSDLLHTVDDLEQAMAAASGGGGGGDSNVDDGVALVHGNLLKVLESHGVRRVEALVGTTFNPEIHEAVLVTKIDDAQEQTKGTISVVAREGYMLNELVLRATRVGVYKEQE